MLYNGRITKWTFNKEIASSKSGVSFTKLCDALYDHLTRRRSHKLILRTICYITLGCVTRALPCVAPRVTSCVGTQEPYVRTRRTNMFFKDPPGYITWLYGLILFWNLYCSLVLEIKVMSAIEDDAWIST